MASVSSTHIPSLSTTASKVRAECSQLAFPLHRTSSNSRSLKCSTYKFGIPELRGSRNSRSEAVRNRGSIRANWKQEILWTDVKVSDKKQVAESLFSVTLDISDNAELQSGYVIPGQFVQVKIGESKPAFLAIASPPKLAAEKGVLEFLIKDVEGSTASLLCQNTCAGDPVSVSQVMGKGFDVTKMTKEKGVKKVLLFATGSGISPIRALIEQATGLDAHNRELVQLFFGVRNEDYLPYKDRFSAWESSGVFITPVFSQPKEGYSGSKGFVQDEFKVQLNKLFEVKKDGAGEFSENPSIAAVLCGHKGMAQDVTALLLENGVPQENILLNF